MKKEITIGEKKFKIKELLYLDTIGVETSIDKKEWFKNMMVKSIIEPEPTDELINSLSFKEGNAIMKEINELNGIGEDFQTPTSTEEKK